MSVFLKALKEIFQHWEILYFLALKDVKIRYKFSSLGFLWAMIQPLGQMIILSIVFTFVVRFKIQAYPAFLLIGLLPWSFFSISINFTTNTFLDHANLVKKVYFPRMLIPMAQVLSNLFDYFFAMIVLIPFLLFFKIGFSKQIVWFPVIILVQFILTFGISLIFSSLNVIFRDIKYIKELLLMVGFYGSPVFYPSTFIRDNMGEWIYRLYYLNPMADLIRMYRDVFYYKEPISLLMLVYTFFISLLLLYLGVYIFKKHERIFADFV